MDKESDRTRISKRDVKEASEESVTRFKRPLVDYLLSGLEENDKWTRIFAADMLGTAGDPRAIAYLKPFLVDRDQDLRTISAHAVETIQARQNHAGESRPDRCESCMIRLIAEEALRQNDPRNQDR